MTTQKTKHTPKNQTNFTNRKMNSSNTPAPKRRKVETNVENKSFHMRDLPFSQIEAKLIDEYSDHTLTGHAYHFLYIVGVKNCIERAIIDAVEDGCLQDIQEFNQAIIKKVSPLECIQKAFLEAINSGRINVVKSLRKDGADVEGAIAVKCFEDAKLNLPLTLAASKGWMDIIQYLWFEGARVSDEAIDDAIAYATNNGHAKVINYLSGMKIA